MSKDVVLLEVKNLFKYFYLKKENPFQKKISVVKAVDDISFTINRGETVGLVGESGCGKSTTARLILQVIKATGGQIFFNGRQILGLKNKDLRVLSKEMQIIFQDPYSSLDPRMTVGNSICEAMRIHHIGDSNNRKNRTKELLKTVGLEPEHINRYPHEFSGGQRQRIGIARALILNPRLIICDEVVSALDVSIQAQIINLLQDMQSEFSLTYLFISHDLSVVKHISDRIAVMYLGKIVELTSKNDLFGNPLHPYSKALFSVIPIPNPRTKKEKMILTGDIPSSINPPAGCRFHTRCPFVFDLCKELEPELKYTNSKKEHLCACHLVETHEGL